MGNNHSSSQHSEDEFLDFEHEPKTVNDNFDITNIIDINTFQRQRDKTIDLFFHNQEVTNLLSEIPDLECKSIDILRKSGDLIYLGKGAYGHIYEFQIIENKIAKSYVLKEINIDFDKYENNPEKLTIAEFADYAAKNFLISKEAFIKLNTFGNKISQDKILDKYYLPLFSQTCLTHKETSYSLNDGSYKKFTIPANSYICNFDIYTEYIIGLLCSRLYLENVSINFIEVDGFTTCSNIEKSDPDDRQTTQYIFMEKIDGSVRNVIMNKDVSVNIEDIDSMLFQLLFGIHCYHSRGINHNDLHPGNIMYNEVTENTMFNGQKLMNADYYHYFVDGIDVYMPATKYIIKIADFGFSVKWSNPIVGNAKTLDGTHNLLPNWFSNYYDIAFSISSFIAECLHGCNIYGKLFYPLMHLITKDMLDDKDREKLKTFHVFEDSVKYLLNFYAKNSKMSAKRYTYRPEIPFCRRIDLNGDIDTSKIFKNLSNIKRLSQYFQKPSDDKKIVTIGYI